MAEKHPIENMASDLNIPKEFTSQLELLKNVLLEIDVSKKMHYSCYFITVVITKMVLTTK